MNNVFVIDVKYSVDIGIVESVRPAHREFLAQGYQKGFLLASGPKTTQDGGIIIGRFASLKEANDFIIHDPFYQHNIATYNITEFSAVLYNECITSYLKG